MLIKLTMNTKMDNQITEIEKSIADEITVNSDGQGFITGRGLARLLNVAESTIRSARIIAEILTQQGIDPKERPFNEVALTLIAEYYAYHAPKTTERARQVYHHLTNTPYITFKKRAKGNKDKGYIYLMETDEGKLKLGFSANPKKRLDRLMRYPGELYLIATKKGTWQEEQETHKRLHATGLSLGNEWYPAERKDELLGYF